MDFRRGGHWPSASNVVIPFIADAQCAPLQRENEYNTLNLLTLALKYLNLYITKELLVRRAGVLRQGAHYVFACLELYQAQPFI